jgi:hypothetical protein
LVSAEFRKHFDDACNADKQMFPSIAYYSIDKNCQLLVEIYNVGKGGTEISEW